MIICLVISVGVIFALFASFGVWKSKTSIQPHVTPCRSGQHFAIDYYREENHICHDGLVTPIDPKTFSNTEPATDFALDKEHVYYLGTTTAIDRSSFEIVEFHSYDRESPLVKDKNHVYIAFNDVNPPFGEIDVIKDADPKTFVALVGYGEEDGYAKDATHVWHVGTLVVGADAPSFHLVKLGGDIDAEDAQNTYWSGKRVGSHLTNLHTVQKIP